MAETQTGHLKPETPGALVSDARAAEIRGELTREHGALWLHYYHRAIEAELARVISNAQLRPEYVQKWIYAHQSKADRELLDALHCKVFWRDDESCTTEATYNAIITKQGITLAAEDDESKACCAGCAFEDGQEVDGMYCGDTPYCSDTARTDKRSVIWVQR